MSWFSLPARPAKFQSSAGSSGLPAPPSRCVDKHVASREVDPLGKSRGADQVLDAARVLLKRGLYRLAKQARHATVVVGVGTDAEVSHF